MKIIVEVLTYNGGVKGVSARKAPDNYIVDESDPSVTEYIVELNDYSEKDMKHMSGGIELHNWHNFNNKGRGV
jgi:nicotinate-nucleotide pyrophosphorylase